MPVQLKNVYSSAFIKTFTTTVNAILPRFDVEAFSRSVFDGNWGGKELKQRMRHVATVLKQHLPGTYQKQVTIICQIVSQLEKQGERGGFVYMFLPDFIEQYGLHNSEISLQAMERITRFTSCEFAIRPFLLNHQEKVMAQMLQWSRHPHANVRRFASEGCRPRLPWALAIRGLKNDPAPILPILENLKADESLFVRKSVANNLNDIAKDHPDRVAELVETWKGISAETDWIIRHGCRTLLKKAHPATYALFDLNNSTDCQVSDLLLSATELKLGERLWFSFQLKTGSKAARLRLEYAVYYRKANNATSRKIFQLSEKVFDPGKTYSFQKEQRFQDFTTRKHYPGAHKLAVVVNGRELAEKEFLLFL